MGNKTNNSDFKSAWSYPLGIFALSRAVFFIPAIISQYFLTPYRDLPPVGHLWYHGNIPSSNYLVNLFVKWDAYWFLNVAQEGYHWQGITGQDPRMIVGHETNLSVFPLLPLLMKTFSFGVFDPSITGFVICNLSFLVGLVYLYKYLQTKMTLENAQRAILYFSLFPTAFVYSSIYSESLFILFTALVFYFWERAEYLKAGISALLLTASRLAGVIIIPALLAWIIMEMRDRKKICVRAKTAIFIAPLGIVGFFLWIWCISGKFNAYFIAQQGWLKEFAYPWDILISVFQFILHGVNLYNTPPDILFIFPIVLFTLWKIWKVPIHLATFWGLGVLLALSSASILGFPRYVGVLFPMFIPLAQLGERKWVHWLILCLFFTVGNFCVIGWVNWYFSF